MLGTIVNTCAIIVGSAFGAMWHRGIKDKYKNVLYDGLGLVSLAVGLNASIGNFPKSGYPVLFIVSIALGGVVGTAVDIDGWFARTVDRHSSPADDRNRLSQGLATAILLYCIGPLSMLGPVVSALNGDNTFLFTNATLDLISSIVFGSTYGVGMVLAAPVLFCWQGLFYAVTLWAGGVISEQLMAELLIVGGLLITGSGLSLLNIRKIKVLNFLPALLVPVVWFLLSSLL